jgi:predicted nucleic acid-binding protein
MSAPTSRHERWALVDTSALYASLDASERDHHAAVEIARRLARERWRLFTTNYIVAEIHALVLVRVNRAVAERVLDELDASPTTVVRATEADEQRARAIIKRYRDKSFSLTDAISFAVMERLGIAQAFTFDRNFAQYGLPMLTVE